MLELVENTLQCPSEFPSTYLGLSISNKKLCRSDLLSWIEEIADRLTGWKASFINLAGRATMIHFVL